MSARCVSPRSKRRRGARLRDEFRDMAEHAQRRLKCRVATPPARSPPPKILTGAVSARYEKVS